MSKMSMLELSDPLIPVRKELNAFAVKQGLPPHYFRLLVMMVFSCFAAPVMKLLPTSHLRHVYIIVVGLGTAWLVFEYNIVHCAVSTTVGYLLFFLVPREYVGTVTTVLAFGHLLGCHVHREFLEALIVYDSAQMILALKLIGVALRFSDAAKRDKGAIPSGSLTDIPPILHYFSFLFFFPTFLVGPVFEYRDYLRGIDENRSAPLMAHVRNFIVILICIGGYLLSDIVPLADITSPSFFSTRSPFARMFLMGTAVMLYRFRFYLVWAIAEMGGVLGGIGYVPATEQWDGIRNIDMLMVECPTNLRVGINNWNIGVSKWLGTYVYKRVGLTKDGKPGPMSTYASFLVSAIWHGFSSGYYIFFLSGAMFIEVAKVLRRNLRGYFHYTEDRKRHPYAIFSEYGTDKAHFLAPLYDIGGMVLSWSSLQYLGISFALLDAKKTYKLWSDVYFGPHIVGMAILLLAQLLPSKPKSKRTKKA